MEKVLQEDILHIDLNIERNKKIPNSQQNWNIIYIYYNTR